MYKIIVYIPETHVEQVKNALFAAGAGRIGNYSHCAWQVKGEGQFMPGSGSQPFLGEINQVEKVMEYEVQIVCEDNLISAAIGALKEAHPYETPAYQVIRCEDL